jgi:hypothetical protein
MLRCTVTWEGRRRAPHDSGMPRNVIDKLAGAVREAMQSQEA